MLYKDNRYIYANRAAEAISGYTAQEILTMRFWDFVHPDHQAFAREQDRKRRQGERRLMRYELKVVTKAGTERWLDLSDAIILLGEEPFGIISAADITERKQVEEELRESRELYALLTDTIPDVIIRTDLEGKITFVNDRTIEISGYSRDDLEGRNVIHFVVDEERGRLLQNEALMTNERLGPQEYHLIMKDRRIIPFEVNGDVLHDMDGTPCGTVHVCRDITARKMSEKMLRQSEEKFSKIFMLSPDCIAITRLADGLIIDTNHGFEEITGWKREIVIGSSFLDVLVWINRTDRDVMVDELKSDRDILHREFRFRRKDGTARTGIYSARPIRIADDACFIFSMRDITDWRRLHEDRQKLEQQLSQAQKMEAIGTLAGGIAHDFNNILSAIMGYSELCLHMADDRMKVRTFMEQALKAAERAKDLVQQILTFSRKVDHEKRPIMLTPIITEIVKFMRASLPATIEIRQTIDEGAGAIMADPTHMHQVLMNLCTNAGHAMNKRGGMLEIGLKEVMIAAGNNLFHPPLNPGLYLELSVRDDGHGISRENLERIFDPYFTTKRQGEGTGLGLAVVHGIVKDHGGEIRVDSEEGIGTTFLIYLPLIANEVEHETEATAAVSGGNGEIILFIDDEQMLVNINKELLEDMGYKVVAETDPVEALQLFKVQSDRFDIIITDKTMPRMTGLEVIRHIREIRADIPVILCSGYQSSEDQDNVKLLSISQLIAKPIRINVLAAAIRNALDAKKTGGMSVSGLTHVLCSTPARS